METSKAVVVAMMILAAVCLAGSNGEMKRFNHPPKDPIRFLVVGDWGRKGLYNQSQVASQMGKIGKKLDIDFIVSTGDNFYENGLTGVNDPDFFESFSDIYTAPILHKQWFSVLGNHDYRGDVEAQLSSAIRQKDERWLCLRSFIVNAGMVDIFFVDTTPFVDEYFINPKNSTYDWSGVLPRQQYLSTLLRENNVDFYLNGHDHCLEHIISAHSNTQYVTSGGGSKAWRGDGKGWNPEELKFYYDGQGFLSVQLNQTIATLAFYDVLGNVLYQWDTLNLGVRSDI